MNETVMNRALRHGLKHNGYAHKLVGLVLALSAFTAYFKLVTVDRSLAPELTPAGLGLCVVGFIGVIFAIYLAAQSIVWWSARRTADRLVRNRGIGGLVPHRIELSPTHLSVKAGREMWRMELFSLKVEKFPDTIIVFDSDISLPIPRFASFVDASYEEFQQVLAKRQRAARWPFHGAAVERADAEVSAAHVRPLAGSAGR
jgi:hypothetical protein